MLLAVLALLAQQDIQVSAELDRDRIEVGAAVTYTIRALVDAGTAVEVTLPPFDGLALVGRTDHREPAGGSGAAELYVVELRLRGERPGLWDIGPVRLGQGTRLALAPALEVMVQAARAASPRASPRVLQLIQRARPPRAGEVGVSLLVSADTVRVGEQVDVVTVAWFPRATLDRLRRPPSIRPPTVDGVYSAVQPSTASIAAGRDVGGVWYDIYVAHQVIFPVRDGRVEVPPATLSFGMPSGRQYFSDERTVQLSSERRRLTVLPLPSGGVGPVAGALTFQYELAPDPARVGEPIPVDLVLSGEGNVALWPAPVARWPDGSRGYPDDVLDQVRLRNGRVSGSKRFRFHVIADSAGSLALPDVRYSFFDVDRGNWSEVVARAVVVPVQPGLENARRREPLPILDQEPLAIARLPGPAKVLLLIVAALAPLLALVRDRRRRRAAAPAAHGGSPATLQLQAAVRSLVPDADHRRRERLTSSLREAGLEGALSQDAARIYHQIATGRFDPGKEVVLGTIEAEAARILGLWPRRLLRAAWLLCLLAVAVPSRAPAQDPKPAAALAWYRTGAEAFAAGQDARAAAEWIVARRLAPRSPEIGAAWNRIARMSRDLSEAGRVFPLTPAELVMVAVVLWVLGWLVWLRVRWSAASRLLMVLASLTAATVGAVSWWYGRPLAVVSRDAALRQAPHGLAAETGRASELAVVSVVSSRSGWRLVESSGGVRGWIPASALAEVRKLDFAP